VEGQDTLQKDKVVGLELVPLVKSFVSFEAVFGDFGGLSDQKILDDLMAELEVESFGTVEVVIGNDGAGRGSEIINVGGGTFCRRNRS
jgi:hypothetical protein